jgi:hypothetical protein
MINHSAVPTIAAEFRQNPDPVDMCNLRKRVHWQVVIGAEIRVPRAGQAQNAIGNQAPPIKRTKDLTAIRHMIGKEAIRLTGNRSGRHIRNHVMMKRNDIRQMVAIKPNDWHHSMISA